MKHRLAIYLASFFYSDFYLPRLTPLHERLPTRRLIRPPTFRTSPRMPPQVW